jgi:hypothetical protein
MSKVGRNSLSEYEFFFDTLGITLVNTLMITIMMKNNQIAYSYLIWLGPEVKLLFVTLAFLVHYIVHELMCG